MAFEPISTDEKRQALERVLGSRAFARADQLRGFLRYVCEAEFDGRAQELNEYALGVTVLGRPPDYSPAEDSCVRKRAYELRAKLRTYYQNEAPEEPIQIEMDKGAYIPRFARRTEAAQAGASREATIDRRSRSITRLSLAALVIGALLAAISLLLFHRVRQQRLALQTVEGGGLTPEMTALWKPFLNGDAPLLISFEIRLFFYATPSLASCPAPKQAAT